MANLNESYPIVLQDRVTAIEAAQTADESALFGSSTTGQSCCDLQLTSLAAPLNTAVTQGGTAGSTNYTYVVADVGNAGTFAPAAGVQTTTGNATLTTTNFNSIAWSGIVGHTYNIYRSASSGTPSSTGLIGTVTATSVSPTFKDTGIVASGNVPTANTTGAVSSAGPVFGGSAIMPKGTPATENTVGAATLTVAEVLSGIIVRGGSQVGAFTDTTPTAAQLVAALPGVKVGSFFDVYFRNTTGQTETVAAGTGVTSASGNTMTLATVTSKKFRFVFTNVTVGSEAVTLYSMGAASAY